MTPNTDTELEVREKLEVEKSQGETTWEGSFFHPDVDIHATEDRIVLLADMPGVQRDNLDIDLREGVLSLVGRITDVSDDFKPLHEEYRVGGYARRFTLSDDIDADKIEASLKDGVLELVLPKAEKALPRKIEVQLG